MAQWIDTLISLACCFDQIFVSTDCWHLLSVKVVALMCAFSAVPCSKLSMYCELWSPFTLHLLEMKIPSQAAADFAQMCRLHANYMLSLFTGCFGFEMCTLQNIFSFFHSCPYPTRNLFCWLSLVFTQLLHFAL